MSLDAYPDVLETVRATLPIDFSQIYRSLSTEYENGAEQKRLIDGFPKRAIRLTYSPCTFSSTELIRQFYEKMRGEYTKFYFFMPNVSIYKKELVGAVQTPPALPLTLDLPSRLAQSYTLYVDDTPLTAGSDYSFIPSTSITTPDRAIISSWSPNIGAIFSFSFTGRLMVVARFEGNGITSAYIKNIFVNMNVSLVGVFPVI